MAEAAKRRGLDGIAITDHDCSLAENEAEMVSREVSILIIPGVEVTTASGHLLVLSPQSSFSPKSPFIEVAKRAIADGSVAIIPHPTDPFSHGVGAQLVKALPFRMPLEAMNASTVRRYNRSASELAASLSLPMTAGSDAHMSIAVGDAFTVLEAQKRDVASVLDAIKNGRTSAVGRQTPFSTTLLGVLKKLYRHAKLENKKNTAELP